MIQVSAQTLKTRTLPQLNKSIIPTPSPKIYLYVRGGIGLRLPDANCCDQAEFNVTILPIKGNLPDLQNIRVTINNVIIPQKHPGEFYSDIDVKDLRDPNIVTFLHRRSADSQVYKTIATGTAGFKPVTLLSPSKGQVFNLHELAFGEGIPVSWSPSPDEFEVHLFREEPGQFILLKKYGPFKNQNSVKITKLLLMPNNQYKIIVIQRLSILKLSGNFYKESKIIQVVHHERYFSTHLN